MNNSELENYCKYGHYEEFNDRLPECINEWAPIEKEYERAIDYL